MNTMSTVKVQLAYNNQPAANTANVVVEEGGLVQVLKARTNDGQWIDVFATWEVPPKDELAREVERLQDEVKAERARAIRIIAGTKMLDELRDQLISEVEDDTR